jgi:hypothetical protein
MGLTLFGDPSGLGRTTSHTRIFLSSDPEANNPGTRGDHATENDRAVCPEKAYRHDPVVLGYWKMRTMLS